MNKNYKMNIDKTFKNKKVIITGHTGFKGSWLTLWLSEIGAKVLGISKNIPTNPSHYKLLSLEKKIQSKKIDIKDFKKVKKIIKQFKPDFIFHLAAQSIVKKSYKDTIETWKTNLLGTINILESLKENKKQTVTIIITSDKCYKNFETKRGYVENDILGGEDPYGASKSAAEIAINSYVKSFFNSKKNKNVIVSTRAGNVIGGGDWTDNRLLPDCIKSWSKRKIVKIRNLNSTRPWQHVLDVVYGYLLLGVKAKYNKRLHGESFNFGPDMKNNYKVLDVLKKSKSFWRNVKWKEDKKIIFKENTLLNLNNSKSKKILKWRPILNFRNTVKLTIEWYKSHHLKKKMTLKSINQIKYYKNLI